MIDETKRCLDRADGGDTGRRLALDHDDLAAERPRGHNLGMSGAAAGIFGHQDVDSVIGQQLCFAGYIKRPARKNVAAVRYVERRIDWIDATHQIAVLGCRRETPGLLPADGEEDAALRTAQSGDSTVDIVNSAPAIAGNRFPCRTTQREERNARSLGSQRGICRDLVGEGMRRVNKQVDIFLSQVISQPLDAAKAADSRRQRQGLRVGRAPGERNHRVDIRSQRQDFSQAACLGRAAQDQDTVFAHG